jgi:hypothetical protein
VGEVRTLEEALRRHIELLQCAEQLSSDGEHSHPEYRRGYRDALSNTAVWSGLVGTEDHLLQLLEAWRVEFDAMREALSEESQPR